MAFWHSHGAEERRRRCLIRARAHSSLRALMQTLADRIDALARARPAWPAFLGDAGALTWREYAERSDRFAAHLAALGLAPGERVAVLLPDGPGVHVAYVACEKAGLVVVGIGPRAGREEIRHLLAKSGAARARFTRGRAATSTCARSSPSCARERAAAARARRGRGRARAGRGLLCAAARPGAPRSRTPPARGAAARRRRSVPAELDLRHDRAAEVRDARPSAAGSTSTSSRSRPASSTPRDVFLSALPAPFGFGIWTAHVTPTALGAPCVLARSSSTPRGCARRDRARARERARRRVARSSS